MVGCSIVSDNKIIPTLDFFLRAAEQGKWTLSSLDQENKTDTLEPLACLMAALVSALLSPTISGCHSVLRHSLDYSFLIQPTTIYWTIFMCTTWVTVDVKMKKHLYLIGLHPREDSLHINNYSCRTQAERWYFTHKYFAHGSDMSYTNPFTTITKATATLEVCWYKIHFCSCVSGIISLKSQSSVLFSRLIISLLCLLTPLYSF